jgi:nucleoside-diphosphate-sugar epimerase
MAGRHPKVLLTGATGQIGSRLTTLLRAAGREVLAVALDASPHEGIEQCDLRKHEQIAQLFASRSIGTIVHLAGVLPTAFRADPIAGADVNLTGTLDLLREAVGRAVKRFIFGSSLSVYGSAPSSRALNERDPTAPDEPYGAAKRVVELVGESLVTEGFSFVALRIARVVGPGAKSLASAWRSEVCETAVANSERPITLPFAPTARLSLLHVDEVARMLQLLVEAADTPHPIYNAPAEVWETQRLAHLIEAVRRVPVRMGDAEGGPRSDGSLFSQDFGFRLRGLADYLRPVAA